MAFNRFGFTVGLQAVLLGVNSSLFVLIFGMEYMVITKITLIIIWLLQIIILVRYVKRTNNDISKFLLGVLNRDSSFKFKEQIEQGPFAELYSTFNFIISEQEKEQLSRKEKEQFFRYTIEHLRTGLIAIDQDGLIEVVNNAFLKLFRLKTLSNLEQLNEQIEDFSGYILNLPPNTNELKKVQLHGQSMQLSVRCAYFCLRERNIKLISLQNIISELEYSEVEVWQKMIRILNHEILNSVSPINLLTSSLLDDFNERLDNNSLQLENDEVENTIMALKTIKKRSIGLTRFVENYQKLSRIPDPLIAPLEAKILMDHIYTLFRDQLQTLGIVFRSDIIPENFNFNIDERLLDQVLINLMKNAIQSLEESKNEAPAGWEPQLYIVMSCTENNKTISVIDNGKGISDAVHDHIFTPFYTTKESGSGIGLSVSRQIMKLHHGNILLDSTPYENTTFSLVFKG